MNLLFDADRKIIHFRQFSKFGRFSDDLSEIQKYIKNRKSDNHNIQTIKLILVQFLVRLAKIPYLVFLPT